MLSVSRLKQDLNDIRDYTQAEDHDESLEATYCLLHVDQLKDLQTFKCMKCENKGENVSTDTNIKTYGMASAINLKCNSCEVQTEINPRPSVFAGRGSNGEPSGRSNNAWYETNIRLVLGTLAVGNGAMDLGDFAAIVDLPQALSFSKRPFNRIESIVGEYLRDISADSMEKAMEEEIKLTLEDQGISYEKWKNTPFRNRPKVLLTVSFNMGWQKRSSGNRSDSLSGHAFMVGARTKKIIQCVVSSKMCRKCLDAEKTNEDPIPHKCPRNYSGSSKAMEADAALEAYLYLHEASHGTAHIAFIIADDDSSMRSYLKHQNSTNKKGNLPQELVQPEWLADPTHRTKIVSKAFFALAATGKSNTECTPVDATRIKRYWGHMIKMYRESPMKQFKKSVKAVLEHLFDNHRYCDIKWCRVLKRENQQAVQTPTQSLPLSDPAGTTERNSLPPSPERSHPPAIPSERESYQLTHPEEAINDNETKTSGMKGYYRSKEKNSVSFTNK